MQKLSELLTNPILWVVLPLLAPGLIADWMKVWAGVVSWFTKRGDAKEATLAALIEKEGESVIAAVAQGKSIPDAIAHGKAAVIAAYAESHGELLKDVSDVLGDAISGKLSFKVKAPAVVSTGNASVTMPTALVLLACLFTGTAVAQTAPAQAEHLTLAQIENPPVPDHWEIGILPPGLRFNLTGLAPADFAGGLGATFNYLFGRVLLTPAGKPAIPWFGVSLFAQGGLNISDLLESENASIGAGVIFLNQLIVGWSVDLAAGGPNGASGLLTGKVSLANTGPVVFYNFALAQL
jgi:hypothetical protein